MLKRNRTSGVCKVCKNKLGRENSARRKASGQASEYEKRPATKKIRLNIKFKMNYGITLREYERLESEQGGKCRICNRKETEISTRGQKKPNRLTVDHDHETGIVRGLLCAKCNQGIGCFGETTEMLKKAIAYLEAEPPELKVNHKILNRGTLWEHVTED